MTLGGTTRKGQKGPTILELVLRLEGDIRGRLEPIRVTPLQAGALLFLHRHAEAKLTDAAMAPAADPPTSITDYLRDLFRYK